MDKSLFRSTPFALVVRSWILIVAQFACSPLVADDADYLLLGTPDMVLTESEVRTLVRSCHTRINRENPLVEEKKISEYFLVGHRNELGALSGEMRCYGPLLRNGDSLQPVGSSSTNFTSDQKLDQNLPHIRLMSNGALQRLISSETRGLLERQELVATRDSAIWQTVGKYRPLPRHDLQHIIYVESQDGGHLVEKLDDGDVHVYQTSTGERITDNWLQAIVTDLCTMKGADPSFLTITADLKHVLYQPLGGSTFEFHNESYDGQRTVVAYKRPDFKPQILNIDIRSCAKIVVIDNQIGIVKLSKDGCSVYSLEEKLRFRLAYELENELKEPGGVRVTHLGNALILAVENTFENSFTWITWHFRTSRAVKSRVDFGEYFAMYGNKGLVPKRAILIRE